MGMCLTANAHPHREWDVPHRQCTSSPGMHTLTGNTHSLYKVERELVNELPRFAHQSSLTLGLRCARIDILWSIIVNL